MTHPAPLAALLAALLTAPASAAPPELTLPLDCTLGESCFIQNYVDDDPGPGAVDFACGALTYDGHKGTDFALRSRAAMEAGVTVRAAAPGVVLGVRDGMPDTGRDGTPPEVLAGKDCGNGVVIDHGDGWQTQYCHLKQGSVAVGRGARVERGAALGEVGLSGRTQFAHVHLSLRHDGAVVDPFDPDGAASCPTAAPLAGELWRDPIPYVAGGFVSAGIASAVPAYADIKSGAAARESLPADAPALVGWAQVFGGRPGDVVEIVLTDPAGKVLHRHSATLEKKQARLFRAAGRRAPAEGWAEGDWQITARLLRAGAVLDEITANVRVAP